MAQIKLRNWEGLNIYFLSMKNAKWKENKTLTFLIISNIESFTICMMLQIFEHLSLKGKHQLYYIL